MRIRTAVTLILLALASCGTDATAPSGDDADTRRPTNLDLQFTLQGGDTDPEGDGSGVVFMQATGTNVSYFRFRLDDGSTYRSDDGSLTHIFRDLGSNTYRITAIAYSEANLSDSIARDVRVRVAPPEVDPGGGDPGGDPGDDGEMTLVWSDEFEYDGPVDPSLWHHQVIPILGNDWANGEQQHYTDRTDNSYVSDGTLKIVARRESYEFRGVTKQYTSARLNSKFAFQYGRVDIRARLPAEAGTWPAFWTLGANINEPGNFFGTTYGSVGWPACGEIDIMEQKGWDKGNTIGHLHWGDTRTGVYENEGSELPVSGVATEFNIYSLEWTAEEIRILFNDQVVHAAPNTQGMPYDDLHYVLLNIAMGGNLGGEIPANFTDAVMEIDYIRIYQ